MIRGFLKSLKNNTQIISFFQFLYRVFFLFLVLFNLTSRSYFWSDFVDRYINLFTLSCAIEWGVDHNSIIAMCGVTSRYVKSVFFLKTDFSLIKLKFLFFNFLTRLNLVPRHASMDAKFYRRFENIIKENLPNFGKFGVPLTTLLQRKLEKWGLLN